MATVRDPSPEAIAAQQDCAMLDALMAGTAAMRAAGPTFLPKWPNESQDAYDARLKSSVLFSAYSRTVSVLTGKPFSKPVTLGDATPEWLIEWAENIDLQGRDLHAFAAAICQACLSHGFAGILVEYPVATNLRTVAEEKAAGVRPYFVQIASHQILGWQSRRIAGAETLTQIRFLEFAQEPDGRFHSRDVEQVRVLEPGRWEIWRRDPNELDLEKAWKLFEEGATSLPIIPFVPVYGERVCFMRGKPPLIDLAHLNVRHWQSQSDQDTILHVARVPILFGQNLVDTKLTVGASTMISGDADSDLKYVEHSGKAIEAGAKSILQLEDQMRQIGAELLVVKPGNITVSQTVADNEPGTCALQRIIQDQEDALEQALGLMCDWVKRPADIEVEIWQDFGVSDMPAATFDSLIKMAAAGLISRQTLFAEAQRRGIVQPERTWPEEIARLAASHPEPDGDEGKLGPGDGDADNIAASGSDAA